MTEEQAELILSYLRKFDLGLQRVEQKLVNLTVKVASVEAFAADLERATAEVYNDIAGIQVWMGITDKRLERIENRLDLTEGPAP